MNHIIKLLFLCLFFATACSQEEMNEVLKNHAEMEGQANSIEELCKNMNRDIVALKLIINSSESGDYITGFKGTCRWKRLYHQFFQKWYDCHQEWRERRRR